MHYLICLSYLDHDDMPSARALTGQQQFFVVSYLVISPILVDYFYVGPLHASSLTHLLPLHASIQIMKTHYDNDILETIKETQSFKRKLPKKLMKKVLLKLLKLKSVVSSLSRARAGLSLVRSGKAVNVSRFDTSSLSNQTANCGDVWGLAISFIPTCHDQRGTNVPIVRATNSSSLRFEDTCPLALTDDHIFPDDELSPINHQIADIIGDNLLTEYGDVVSTMNPWTRSRRGASVLVSRPNLQKLDPSDQDFREAHVSNSTMQPGVIEFNFETKLCVKKDPSDITDAIDDEQILSVKLIQKKIYVDIDILAIITLTNVAVKWFGAKFELKF